MRMYHLPGIKEKEKTFMRGETRFLPFSKFARN
jgi:hypothetical protein